MIELINLIRDLIRDNYKSALDVFKFETSNIFTLSFNNVNESSIKVYVNEEELDPQNYTYDNIYNRIKIINISLQVGDIIAVYYTYTNYSDNEIISYINNALINISINGGFNYRYSDGKFYNEKNEEITLTLKEKRLIAFVASILINEPAVKSYKTPEISVTFADSMSKEDRIKTIIRDYETILGYMDYCSLKGTDC